MEISELKGACEALTPDDFVEVLSPGRIQLVKEIVALLKSADSSLTGRYHPHVALTACDTWTLAQWFILKLKELLTRMTVYKVNKERVLAPIMSDTDVNRIIVAAEISFEEIREAVLIAQEMNYRALLEVGAARNLVRTL